MLLEHIPKEEQDVDILTKAILRGNSNSIEAGLGYLIIYFLFRGSVENAIRKS